MIFLKKINQSTTCFQTKALTNPNASFSDGSAKHYLVILGQLPNAKLSQRISAP